MRIALEQVQGFPKFVVAYIKDVDAFTIPSVDYHLLLRGAVHKADRPGSDYDHFLAYLKTRQDMNSGTSRAVHVAVTKPQNSADLEKSELFSRRPDEKGWLFPKVDLTEAETDLDLESDDEEAGLSGTYASNRKESPREDSRAIGSKHGK